MPPLSWRKEMNILMSSFLATGLLLVGGVFGRWQKSPPDLDQQVLDQLKKAGSDLSKQITPLWSVSRTLALVEMAMRLYNKRSIQRGDLR
jgi:hypothetical protein